MHKIHCKLPAPFLVYFVIALGLQMALPTREVRQADKDPDRLSFTHTVRVLRRTLPQAAALPPSAVVGLVSGRPD